MTDALVVLALFIGMALFLWVFHVLDEQRKEQEHERAAALEKLKGEVSMKVAEANRDMQKELMDHAKEIRKEDLGEDWRH